MRFSEGSIIETIFNRLNTPLTTTIFSEQPVQRSFEMPKRYFIDIETIPPDEKVREQIVVELMRHCAENYKARSFTACDRPLGSASLATVRAQSTTRCASGTSGLSRGASRLTDWLKPWGSKAPKGKELMGAEFTIISARVATKRSPPIACAMSSWCAPSTRV